MSDGQRPSPEQAGLASDMKADRVRADTQLAILDIGRFIARRVEVYPCSAPQSDRQYVWHAEIGSHAADVDRQRGFTRETLCQHADVASGPDRKSTRLNSSH